MGIMNSMMKKLIKVKLENIHHFIWIKIIYKIHKTQIIINLDKIYQIIKINVHSNLSNKEINLIL